ncbi:MAG: trypsin-like peptidase domain-containing protein [Candidatus Omnitrophica bacterium]|nr:trypsin-like peptidase domain-containing protein [Candidatus Omnitrophota bacterium]
MFRASRIIPALIITLIFTTLIGPMPCSWAKNNLIDRIEQAKKSIVTVQTVLTKTLSTNSSRQGTFFRKGCGIIIDPSGIIVTNKHTIIHAPFIFVILRDGTKLPARVVAYSQNCDFCFLKVHTSRLLQRVRWADSSNIKPQTPVFVIGNSDYNNQSIISGHIENLLHGPHSSKYNFLALDLELYHGDSGDPVFDDRGRLLGMIMARKNSPPYFSIAIAANKIHRQYLQYKKFVSK